MRYLLLFTIMFIANNTFGQDTTIIGNYYGKNLYVTNPSVQGTTDFCISQVLVNDKKLGSEIFSNSFEIDFALYEIALNSVVKIKISYNKTCSFKIINPEALMAKSTFAFVNAKVDKSGKLNWTVKGEIASSFVVEQYKWNKWINTGEVEISDTVHKNMYQLEIKPHFGPNIFRISHTDINGSTTYSKPVKYRSATLKEVFLTSQKVTTQLDFSAETMYEIFDEKGNFISDGTAQSVDISDLPKGKYWVNYDSKSEMFTKK